MMLIPFSVANGVYSVFVILEDENLARMKDNDPAQLNIWKLPEEYRRLTLRDVIITSPSPEDVAHAVSLIRQGQQREAFEHLSRGFKFKPKAGDNDLPYQAQGKPS